MPLQPIIDLEGGSALSRWKNALAATAVACFNAVQQCLFLPLVRRFAADLAQALLNDTELHMELYPSVSL